MEQAPFFVVGAGRSGTTLLRLILTGHSRLHVPPETWFLRPLVRQFPLNGALTQPQAERAVSTMVQHERWPDLGMPAELLQRQVAARARHPPPPTLRELIDVVYQYLASGSGKPRIGDKTPHYFAIVPELATLYPTAKFIHLVRDGRDVAISWIDAGWERYYLSGFEWPHAVAALLRDRATLADRVLHVRYEDLVRQPDPTARNICAFLGETFEPAMLDWHGRAEQVAARDRHLHGTLQRALSEEAVAVWRRRLSTAECFAVEACLHRELSQAGYALRFDAHRWRALRSGTAWLLRAFAPVLRRGVPFLQKRGALPRNCYF